jgi:hypothetical protein
MSAIPPDIAGAAAQAGFASASAARTRDADRSGQGNVADQQRQARVDQANSVDADDLDTAVFADAEGAGSQGRAFADGQQDADEPSADASETLAATDDDPDEPRLDIQA